MDEDDSQDELINRNTSHSKGKRAALWAISDDSDDLDEESEEGGSDSDDEEEEDRDDEEEGIDEEDDDDEVEEDPKPENGAFGETSADFGGMSSDEDSEKCPICLNSFNNQPVATPENCEHYFCFDCILEWAKNANSCPVDRIAFNNIYLRKCYGGRVKKMITVQKPVKAGLDETVDLNLEQTNCEVCGGSDREDRLLLCDGCDAGYHMECLTPPLDSVPVEEWFCPECEANNRLSRGSAEELTDTESLSSPARPATSRSQPRTAGPTRAIARTQQSERVRASVNRHRITQARTSQLAPTYLIQSTWLDETINAVVAGLNTAVYVRDVTPRAPSGRRRRTRKRRKVKSKMTSSKGSTGTKRKKWRAKRSKARKKLMMKKTATPRSRIANNLGIVKDKKSSSLPSVYRPSEHTLSNMRADIGAASLSIYGDPFDLDPFADHEEDEQETHITSLLEAKRRGISRSALRSHQPVARPVTASLSRSVPHSGGVVESAPVPDLLGSILSGQSILLMDSSDVVINRDGSLKASKPMIPSTSVPCSRKSSSSSSGDTSTLVNPEFSSNLGDSPVFLHHNGNLPGSAHTSTNGLFTQNYSHLSPFMPSSAPPRGSPSLPLPHPNRPNLSPCHREASEVRTPRETTSSSIHPIQDSSFKNKGMAPSQSQPKKAPVKPMWVDVSVLPRIPKIKREGSFTNGGTSQGGSYTSDKVGSSKGNGSNSTGTRNGFGLPESSVVSLSGDKGKQQSVDQQKGHSDGQAQKNRPDRTSSSSTFSNSFSSSSSSSSSGTSANQARHASFSSSSAVSFRINSSGNSWHARRLNITSSSSSGSNLKERWREKEQEAKKKQLHKDRQVLLASRSMFSEESDNNIYDPFNPTLSDSSSSGDETRSPCLNRSPQCPTREGKASTLESKKDKKSLVQVKTETQEAESSQEEPGSAQNTVSQEISFSEDRLMVKQESKSVDMKTGRQTIFLDTKIKQEPNSDESDQEESESGDGGVKSELEIKCEVTDTTPPAHQSVDQLHSEQKREEGSGRHAEASNRSLFNYREDLSASSSTTTKKKLKEDIKSDSTSSSKSPLLHKKHTSKSSKEQQSGRSDTDRGRREDHHGSETGDKKKEKDKDRSSRRSRSRERRRARSSSNSSQSNSPDRTRRKRRRSRSRSIDETGRRRSRSRSESSSRERSRMKKNKQKSKERSDHRERSSERRQVSKDKRRGQSRSKSRSRSRTRSESKDNKRGVSRSKSRSRSRERRNDHTRSLSSKNKVESRSKDKNRQRIRSRSRERRKEERTSKEKTSDACVSSSKGTNRSQGREKENNVTQRTIEVEKNTEVYELQFPSSSSAFEVKKEEGDFDGESQIKAAEYPKKVKNEKQIKEETRSVDMFEDSPVTNPIKVEENDSTSLSINENIDEMMEDPNKTESCDITNIKSEPLPTPLCSSALVPSSSDILQDMESQSQTASGVCGEQQNTVSVTVPVKQEPSDSDEDFNVDVMLDSLDYVKSEHTEGSVTAAKEETGVVEGKEEKEGEQVSTVVGSKSKTQVKRVTWNIQEQEGPQPEKSLSKLALYKLKLKQEGFRKPSLAVQTSSQDSAGASTDPSKRSAVDLLSIGSGSTDLQPEEFTTGQTEAEEGDLSRKDKYLKKLHMQERAVEEVKLAIKPFYQKRDINKDEYKEILRKAVQKVCHSKSGEINPVKVGNLIKAYVEKYKHARKHIKGGDLAKVPEEQTEPVKLSDSP